MSDSPPISSTQTTQATHPAKVAPSTSGHSSEAIIKQVSPALVTVSSTAQGQPVALATNEIKGQLDPKLRYNVSVTIDVANTATSTKATPQVSTAASLSSVQPSTESQPKAAPQPAIGTRPTVGTQQATSTPILLFTSTQTTSAKQTNATISSQQLERVLSLPPGQIQAARIPPTLLSTQAQVVAIDAKLTTLTFTSSATQQSSSVSLSTSSPAPNPFRNGEILNVQLKPVGNQWQILLNSLNTGSQSIITNVTNDQISPLLKQMLVDAASKTPVQGNTLQPRQNTLPFNQNSPQIVIDSKALGRALTSTAPLIRDANIGANTSQSNVSTSQNIKNNPLLMTALQSSIATKLHLAINKDGGAVIQNIDELNSVTTKPSAQIQITGKNIDSIATLLKTLNVPVDAQTHRALLLIASNSAQRSAAPIIDPLLNQSLDRKNLELPSNHQPINRSQSHISKLAGSAASSFRQGINQFLNNITGDQQATAKAINSETASTILSNGSKPDSVSKSTAIHSTDSTTAKTPPIGRQAGTSVNNEQVDKANIVAPQMTPKVKAQAIEVLHSLLRVVQARAEQPSESLTRIASALNDTQFIEEPGVKGLKEHVLEQIKQNIPQGKEQDANQIRQLLTNQALSLSATQIVSPVSGQGMLSGLVTLIQISLASRFARNQPHQSEKLSKGINSLFSSESSAGSGKTNSSAPVSSKGLNEFAQLEQKHQILREISRLFAGHQSSKIGNAEQLLQGQDSFYYTLPSAFGNKLQDIELLVRRESDSREDGKEDANDNNRIWHLTMKLSAGDLGELLTKAKLRQGTLELDFYTSNEQTKHQVMNYLPLFNKRLTALGIEVTKTQCQLGKIPDTLRQRPYHLLQTKV
ncbi:hypothetical protein Patl_3257 [Paraglaciecola sp. T6c]|uniref:flagellar hook-length control protein FliK n=1 Tax=Pseudoalteromonas atlantica (strain T6c / ATCC BAA-1087) TaxID=3042615 RepID=UPI00005C58D3|nr:flagellar hook-length control protein FliK [Paraglaciecola sp. T6c]ABG41763.1 hypothetical protein Patl_3257 [Paraglaciecola sp. T6c]